MVGHHWISCPEKSYKKSYRMVKNFGKIATVKHWLWRIDAQKTYYKAFNYLLVKLHIVKIVTGRLPRVERMMMFGFAVDSMIRGYHEYKSIWENPSADR